MIDLSTGKSFSRRDACKGLAAIIAAGCAPSIVLAASRSAGSIGGLLGSANATVGGMMRNKGAQLSCVFDAKPYGEELEYLEANGNQYIDTCYQFVNGFKMVAKALSLDKTNDSRVFFGSNANGCRNFIGFNYYNVSPYNTEFVLGLGGSAYKYCGRGVGIAQLNYEYDIDIDVIGTIASQFTFYINGSSVSVYPVSGTTGARLNLNCYLFACNGMTDTNHTMYGRMYYCKLWDERTENPKLDFIPVLKNGVPCMYDKVGGGFYYNVTSGHQFGYKQYGKDPVSPY